MTDAATNGSSALTSAGPALPALRLQVGPMTADRHTHAVVVAPDLPAFLSSAQPADTVVQVLDDGPLWALDIDTHSWEVKPTAEHLAAVAAALDPMPTFWFVSHGMGLKGLYLGSDARLRAVAAGLCVPPSFAVEILPQFRHPGAPSSKHGGGVAGVVHHDPHASGEPVSSRLMGPPRPEQVQALLTARGMSVGGRYDHSLCPIAGDQESDAGDCVVPLTQAIVCHRCANKGITYPGVRKPGVVPYAVLMEGTASHIAEMAAVPVHWRQAKAELAHRYSHLGSAIREEAYQLALRSVLGDGDPRIPQVFNRDLQVVYSEGGWIDPESGKPTRMDDDIVNALPAVQVVVEEEFEDDDGHPQTRLVAKVNPPKRSNLKHRVPIGFTPWRLFRGIYLGGADGIVPYEVPPMQRYPVRLLDRPLPLEEAWAQVAKAFPGMNQAYCLGLIAAPICAEVRGGQAIGITATGPSGSGKGETPAFAASVFGDTAVKVQLCDDANKFMRLIGTSTSMGHRFLVLDEMGKIRGLQEKMALLLQISGTVSYNLHYDNSLTSAPFRSVLVYPCVRFPDWLRSSPEFLRRTRGVHLPTRVDHWMATSGGDTAEWRGRCERHALVCNSLLTHVYKLCADACFLFTGATGCVADRLGLGSLADGAEGVDPEHLRELYRHARGQRGDRTFIAKDSHFSREWIDLKAPSTKSFIGPFVDGEETDFHESMKAAQNNLEAADWNGALGINDVPIACMLRRAGSRWGLRFYKAESCKKGDEVLNAALPPIPSDVGAVAPIVSAAMATAVVPAPNKTVNPLAAAGFPT